MNTGTLWYMTGPLDTEFAQAGLRSPVQSVVPALCARCGRGARHVMPRPLTLEWEPGSDRIGDFTWLGGIRATVKRHVADIMINTFRGVRAESIEMVQDPKAKPPKRRTGRSKPRVWLPYIGPELVELWPERLVPFLPRTTFERGRPCKDCGDEPALLSGFEVKKHRYDLEKGELVPDIYPRIPGKGVFVSASDVGETPIFRLAEFTGPILCTDRVRNFIQEQGLSNVDFREYGDVL